MNGYQKFYVGVNVFVVKGNQLLLGKRKNVYGDGDWGLPGGHMEPYETMEETAARELEEETGLIANEFEFTNLVNDAGRSSVEDEGHNHYLQVGFIAKGSEGEVSLREPDRCHEWKWFSMDELPKNIFKSHIQQIENFLEKKSFANT